MPRGKAAQVGDKTINRNGYEHTKTADRGWVGTHILVMEEHLGRTLNDNERVRFKTQDTTNFGLDNLELYYTGTASLRKQEAVLEERIRELQEQLRRVKALIAAAADKA